jgi:PTS system mannose-specific IIC component
VPGPVEILLAALAGGIATLERKALLQSMISRPIVIGPLVGWALGDPMGGLFVGAPLELLWSGAANLGAALPHHETAATAAIAAAAVSAQAHAPAALASDHAVFAGAAFAALAPVALAGRRLEALAERANEGVVARATVAMGEGLAGRGLRLHLVNLWRPLVLAALATALAAAAVGPALAALLARAPELAVDGLRLGWAMIWAAGGASAVRAARLPLGLALAVGGAMAALVLWGATLLVG